ncbi:hypothetical protein [Sphingomonas piscis]|nr:hypothetical protein [Sphingomonas piscis]
MKSYCGRLIAWLLAAEVLAQTSDRQVEMSASVRGLVGPVD